MRSLFLVAVVCLWAGGLGRPCPGGKSECPDSATCCALQGGGYGCCPMPRAVCCNDHIHCCPSETQCDVSHGSCLRANGTHHSQPQRKTPARPLRSVKCGDSGMECPDSSTCCALASGGYGCCPMPRAVCCADHVHCCPAGTTCDVSHSACLKADRTLVPWSAKTSAFHVAPFPLPPPTFACGRGNCTGSGSCCGGQGSGPGACCPFKEGSCCRDKDSCCPKGWSCHSNGCRRHGFRIRHTPTAEVVRAGAEAEGRERCGDGSTCPPDATCCPTADAHHFACCPMARGRCCEGYCCPEAFTCGTSGRRSCVRAAFRPLP